MAAVRPRRPAGGITQPTAIRVELVGEGSVDDSDRKDERDQRIASWRRWRRTMPVIVDDLREAGV